VATNAVTRGDIKEAPHSVTTSARSLLRDGLLDELRLQVYPIVVGEGKRLFEESIGTLPLKLVESKITTNGIAILYYQPAR